MGVVVIPAVADLTTEVMATILPARAVVGTAVRVTLELALLRIVTETMEEVLLLKSASPE